MPHTSADTERYQQEYDAKIAELPPSLQSLWGILKDAVDAEFAPLHRFWRSRGYYVQADRNFLALKPNPSRGRIEVRAHLNRPDLPRLQEIFVRDEPHSQPNRPRVQCLLVEDAKDIPKVLEAAHAALKIWGRK